ncbi:macrophage migration inhibitory factor 2 [Elysia marginata]|uniref:L-dopachrome isomerase n=1 Tax=Elysia marginata TaxID=1093978 RepID=A0AAV4HPF9_9GAST|nr:macrophage migration inhibitory factor 2 [Elysia marginata]
MPLCQLYTSKKDAELKEGVELRMSEAVARALGKPLERVSMAVLPSTRLLRLGTLAPSAMLVIASINVFDAQRNPTYTPIIKQALQTELELPAERCLIQYVDLDPDFLG